MSYPWLIFGAGGHGTVVLDTLLDLGLDLKDVSFVDENRGGHVHGVRVIKAKTARGMKRHRFIIAIGDNATRQRVYYQMQDSPHFAGTVIHRYAYVSPNAVIGDGVFIGAQANVGPGAVIDDGCIINTGANVDHDCKVGAFSHVGPHASLCGGVTVGQLCLIGAGTTIRPMVKIGSGATVGAGAAVVKNVPQGIVQVGVPARELKT